MTMIHNDNSANSGVVLVPNARAPQGGISLPVGTGTSLIGSGIGTGTGTGIGTGGIGTGTGTGGSTSTGGPGSGTIASFSTGTSQTSFFTTSTSAPVSITPITTTSPTFPTTTVPSAPITTSSTTATSITTTSATTTSNTSTSTPTPPPSSLTNSDHSFTTFVSTLSDGEIRSFTSPIPTALVSSAPNSSSMNHTTTIVAGTVSAFVFMVLVVLAALFIWRRNGLKLRTRLREQQEREKGKEMRRLLEDEGFAVDDEDRWSGGGQNRNYAPSLNSGFGDPTSSQRPISQARSLTPSVTSEFYGQPPLVPQSSTHARTSSTPTSSSSSCSPAHTRRPNSSNSTLLPASPLGILREYPSQEKSFLDLTPVQSSSSWISRPISATLPPYRDPFGVGPPLLQATLSGVTPQLPVATNSPLSPPPKSLVASPQSYHPSERLRSPKSSAFAQAATITMTTVDAPTLAATNAATSQQPILHRKQSTADSMHSISDSISEYSQESAPLHVHLSRSRSAGRSGEPVPPVPPIPLMPFPPG